MQECMVLLTDPLIIIGAIAVFLIFVNIAAERAKRRFEEIERLKKLKRKR